MMAKSDRKHDPGFSGQSRSWAWR